MAIVSPIINKSPSKLRTKRVLKSANPQLKYFFELYDRNPNYSSKENSRIARHNYETWFGKIKNLESLYYCSEILSK